MYFHPKISGNKQIWANKALYCNQEQIIFLHKYKTIRSKKITSWLDIFVNGWFTNLEERRGKYSPWHNKNQNYGLMPPTPSITTIKTRNLYYFIIEFSWPANWLWLYQKGMFASNLKRILNFRTQKPNKYGWLWSPFLPMLLLKFLFKVIFNHGDHCMGTYTQTFIVM